MDKMSAKKPPLYDRIRATADDACPKVAVQIRKSQPRRGQVQIWILEIAKCPHCSKPHNHGGGSTDHAPALGYRGSHCVTRRPLDYELVASIEEDPQHEHRTR